MAKRIAIDVSNLQLGTRNFRGYFESLSEFSESGNWYGPTIVGWHRRIIIDEKHNKMKKWIQWCVGANVFWYITNYIYTWGLLKQLRHLCISMPYNWIYSTEKDMS